MPKTPSSAIKQPVAPRAKHTNTEVCSKCQEILELAHPRLQEFARARREANKEVHVSWSFRGEVEQNDAKRKGKSRARWGQSPHNFKPSLAIDFFRITPNGEGEWSAPWLLDNVCRPAEQSGLISGARFGDKPHVELPHWKTYTQAGPPTPIDDT